MSLKLDTKKSLLEK